MKLLAIDFETANGNRNSPCSVGVTLVDNFSVTEVGYWMIKPVYSQFHWGNVRVHGIRPADVASAEPFWRLWEDTLSGLFEDRLVVAHNASFDMGVLQATLKMYNIPVPKINYIDSVQVCRRSWPGLESYSLGKLSRHFGLKGTHHHAGSDAECCARLTTMAAETHNVRLPEDWSPRLGVHVKTVMH